MSSLRLTLPLLLFTVFAACQTNELGWPGAQSEDPSPSGPPYLRHYKETHYRSLGDELTASVSREEFIHSLTDKAVLYLGDHHEDRRLHDLMLALLRDLAKSRRLAFGLEAIGTADEPMVARYLDGDSNLEALCDAIRDRWDGSWLDHGEIDSDFYRDVLEFARDTDAPVFALEPTPRLPLERRDKFMAARLRLAHAHMPRRLVVVIVGHAHLLGPGKLVGRVELPHATVGARMSRTLRRAWHRSDVARRGDLVRTDEGVYFFDPPPGI